MSAVADDQVRAELSSIGIPLDNFFTIPSDSEERGLIAFWHPEVGVRYLILEKDNLANACYRYLLKHGARRFSSGNEIGQTAVAEKWPGWDTCADAVRDRQVRDSTQAIASG